jgi:hypothetical protein
MKDKAHQRIKVLPIKIEPALYRAMLLYSRKIDGCPRPEVGSAAHFLRNSALRALKQEGLDMGTIDATYKIFKRLQ